MQHVSKRQDSLHLSKQHIPTKQNNSNMQHVSKRQDSLHLSKQHIAITLHIYVC